MADLRVRSRRVRISARPAAQSANDTGSGDDALEGPGSRMKVYRSRGSRQNKSVGSQCNVVASAVDVTRAESSVRAQIRNVPCDIIRAGSKYRIQGDVRTSPVVQHRSTGVRGGGRTSRTAEPAAGGDLKSHGGDVLRIQQIVGVGVGDRHRQGVAINGKIHIGTDRKVSGVVSLRDAIEDEEGTRRTDVDC